MRPEPVRVKLLLDATLLGGLLALQTNITPNWWGLPGTNTLAYYGNLKKNGVGIIRCSEKLINDKHSSLSDRNVIDEEKNTDKRLDCWERPYRWLQILDWGGSS